MKVDIIHLALGENSGPDISPVLGSQPLFLLQLKNLNSEMHGSPSQGSIVLYWGDLSLGQVGAVNGKEKPYRERLLNVVEILEMKGGIKDNPVMAADWSETINKHVDVAVSIKGCTFRLHQHSLLSFLQTLSLTIPYENRGVQLNDDFPPLLSVRGRLEHDSASGKGLLSLVDRQIENSTELGPSLMSKTFLAHDSEVQNLTGESDKDDKKLLKNETEKATDTFVQLSVKVEVDGLEIRVGSEEEGDLDASIFSESHGAVSGTETEDTEEVDSVREGSMRKGQPPFYPAMYAEIVPQYGKPLRIAHTVGKRRVISERRMSSQRWEEEEEDDGAYSETREGRMGSRRDLGGTFMRKGYPCFVFLLAGHARGKGDFHGHQNFICGEAMFKELQAIIEAEDGGGNEGNAQLQLGEISGLTIDFECNMEDKRKDQECEGVLTELKVDCSVEKVNTKLSFGTLKSIQRFRPEKIPKVSNFNRRMVVKTNNTDKLDSQKGQLDIKIRRLDFHLMDDRVSAK